MSVDTYNLNAHTIKVIGPDNAIEVPVNGCIFQVAIERMDHFSSRGGLRCAERSLVTGYAQGEIHFTPIGDMSFSHEGQEIAVQNQPDYSIPELLDMIIQKQQEDKENVYNENAPE